MAKESGITMIVKVDDSAGSLQTISNDITNLDWDTPRNVQDITGLDKSAMERLQLLSDFSSTLNGVFDDASNMSHDVFKTVPSTSVARTHHFEVSNQVLLVEALCNGYAVSRAQSGELTWSVPSTLSDGTAPTWTTS